jgi:transposase
MIALASGLRIYLACGITDMRKGMIGLSMLVQQTLSEDPFGGAAFAFRGRRAGLIKLIWHDGVGLCMLTKRLEQGQFAWPSASTSGRILLTSAQLAALLDGCEWRAPAPRRRPELAG